MSVAFKDEECGVCVCVCVSQFPQTQTAFTQTPRIPSAPSRTNQPPSTTAVLSDELFSQRLTPGNGRKKMKRTEDERMKKGEDEEMNKDEGWGQECEGLIVVWG